MQRQVITILPSLSHVHFLTLIPPIRASGSGAIIRCPPFPTSPVAPTVTVPGRWCLQRSSCDQGFFCILDFWEGTLRSGFGCTTIPFCPRTASLSSLDLLDVTNAEFYIGDTCLYLRGYLSQNGMYKLRVTHLVFCRIRTVHSPQKALVSTPHPQSSSRTKLFGCQVSRE